MKKQIKILIADDHALVRSGIITLLKTEKEFNILGEACDGEAVIDEVRKLKPDVVLMDISMPKQSGLEAAAIIRKKFSSTRVLILTMHDNEEYAYQIWNSGAGGYILKNSDKTELIAAIKGVAGGQRFFSRTLSDKLADYNRRRPKPAGDPALLTKREREIVKLIADGMTNQEIAERLFISPRTVDTHRSNIMQKLDIKNTAALVRFALESGIITPK